jgi:hypothetical protein
VHSVPEVGWLYFSAGLLGWAEKVRGLGGWEDWEGVEARDAGVSDEVL